jgi:hypothetical protein
MKLEDIKYESKKMFNEARDNTSKVTKNYSGSLDKYQSNKNRATIGIVGGLIALPFVPEIGFAALIYGGVKAYQANKDKNKLQGGNNGYNRVGHVRRRQSEHTF